MLHNIKNLKPVHMDGTQLFFLPLIFLFPLKKSTIRMGPLIGPVVIEYNPPLHTHTHASVVDGGKTVILV